jgi:hypothetical protein
VDSTGAVAHEDRFRGRVPGCGCRGGGEDVAARGMDDEVRRAAPGAARSIAPGRKSAGRMPPPLTRRNLPAPRWRVRFGASAASEIAIHTEVRLRREVSVPPAEQGRGPGAGGVPARAASSANRSRPPLMLRLHGEASAWTGNGRGGPRTRARAEPRRATEPPLACLFRIRFRHPKTRNRISVTHIFRHARARSASFSGRGFPRHFCTCKKYLDSSA